jgi:hypothetical protein
MQGMTMTLLLKSMRFWHTTERLQALLNSLERVMLMEFWLHPPVCIPKLFVLARILNDWDALTIL